MKSKPTIGFVITCHYSDDIRPDGQRFLDRLLTSIDRIFLLILSLNRIMKI